MNIKPECQYFFENYRNKNVTYSVVKKKET